MLWVGSTRIRCQKVHVEFYCTVHCTLYLPTSFLLMSAIHEKLESNFPTSWHATCTSLNQSQQFSTIRIHLCPSWASRHCLRGDTTRNGAWHGFEDLQVRIALCTHSSCASLLLTSRDTRSAKTIITCSKCLARKGCIGFMFLNLVGRGSSTVIVPIKHKHFPKIFVWESNE